MEKKKIDWHEVFTTLAMGFSLIAAIVSIASFGMTVALLLR